MFKLIRATHYPTSVKTKEIYRSDGMNNCLIDICNIWLFSLGWCGLCWRSTVCISCINYQGLFSFFSNMEYLVFEFGVYDIWLLEIMLHCTALHGIWSYVANLWLQPYKYNNVYGHNDVASYLVGYEGRCSSWALLCFFLWLKVGCGGDMWLHTYTVLLWWHALRCGLYHMCASCIHLLYCVDVWLLVDMGVMKLIWLWCFSMVIGILYDLLDCGDVVGVVSLHSFAP